MLKKIITIISVHFFAAFIILSAFAQEHEAFFYYLLAPQSTLTINDEVLSNDLEDIGQMRFKSAEQEEIFIDSQNPGIKVFSKNYRVDVKKNTSLTLTDTLNLDSGSIHISTLPTSIGRGSLQIQNLIINFQSADFIAFVSGDQREIIVKVLEGELEIENPDTSQKAVLKSQQATSTDESGRILIPFPFEHDSSNDWWESGYYDYDYKYLPIAHAGGDQRVLGNIPVVLDGSKSEFITGDIFEWTLKQGPKDASGVDVSEVAFDSTNIVKPLFTPTVEGEYYFSLQITNQNGEKSNLDDVLIYVGRRYLRPIAIFPDVPADHPNNLAITYLYKKNVMRGSEDPETGKFMFRPDDILNRVEILKTVFENKRQDIPTEDELRALEQSIFLDVKPDHWFAPYVYLAKEQGIVKGNDGLYRPADEVLLVEALKIIIKTNQISLDSYQPSPERIYPDAELDAWYLPYLSFVKKYNLVDVDNSGNVHPAQSLTRSKFAEIIYRMESINLLEKRGYLVGKLSDSETKESIANAEIYIYKAIEEEASEDSNTSGFIEKGELFYKTSTSTDGSFSVSLPIHTKFYIEAISDNNVSINKIITEVQESQTTRIDLEILID